MTIEAISQGHEAGSGQPTNGMIGSATSAAPIAIRTVVASGSSVRLMLAFQPAWQAAANSTAAKTKESIRRGLATRALHLHAGRGALSPLPSCAKRMVGRGRGWGDHGQAKHPPPRPPSAVD